MVEVRVQVEGLIPRQHFAQFVGDPRRVDARNLGPHADEFDVRNLVEVRDDPLQRVVGQRQRIAAAQQHVSNLRMLADVLEHRLQFVWRRHRILPNLPLPRAKPAVHRAGVRDDKQHPVRVPVGEMLHRHVVFFVQRIVFQECGILELHRIRHLLDVDGIAGVHLLDQTQVVRRREKRVLLRHGLQPLVLLLRQAGNRPHVAHALRKLLLPFGAWTTDLWRHGCCNPPEHARPSRRGALSTRPKPTKCRAPRPPARGFRRKTGINLAARTRDARFGTSSWARPGAQRPPFNDPPGLCFLATIAGRHIACE